MPASPTTAIRAEIFVIISARVRRRMDHSQSKFETCRAAGVRLSSALKLSP
jgi:hypothetical protein